MGRWPHPRCSPAAPGEAASAGQERPPSEPAPRWPGFPADEARGAPGGRSSTHGHHAHGDESDSTVLAGPQARPAAAPTTGCAPRGPLSSGVTSGAPRSQPANSGWERSSLPRAGVGGTPTVGPLSGPARGQPVAAAQESRAVPEARRGLHRPPSRRPGKDAGVRREAVECGHTCPLIAASGHSGEDLKIHSKVIKCVWKVNRPAGCARELGLSGTSPHRAQRPAWRQRSPRISAGSPAAPAAHSG